jgi:hypothetical protein
VQFNWVVGIVGCMYGCRAGGRTRSLAAIYWQIGGRGRDWLSCKVGGLKGLRVE